MAVNLSLCAVLRRGFLAAFYFVHHDTRAISQQYEWAPYSGTGIASWVTDLAANKLTDIVSNLSLARITVAKPVGQIILVFDVLVTTAVVKCTKTSEEYSYRL